MKDSQIERNEENEAKIARGERLTRVRGMAKLSRADIEKKYGIPANTLKNWELGRNTGLTEVGAKRILTMLQKAGVQCSTGWLLHGAGVQPVLLDVSATDKIELALSKEIEVFCEYHPNALYMQVTDDGMEPYYFVGDYVAGERFYQEAIHAAAVGKHCIVETQTGEILLRRVRQGSKEGRYSLHCVNLFTAIPEPFLYDVELASAAPVIWHRRITTKEVAKPFLDSP